MVIRAATGTTLKLHCTLPDPTLSLSYPTCDLSFWIQPKAPFPPATQPSQPNLFLRPSNPGRPTRRRVRFQFLPRSILRPACAQRSALHSFLILVLALVENCFLVSYDLTNDNLPPASPWSPSSPLPPASRRPTTRLTWLTSKATHSVCSSQTCELQVLASRQLHAAPPEIPRRSRTPSRQSLLPTHRRHAEQACRGRSPPKRPGIFDRAGSFTWTRLRPEVRYYSPCRFSPRFRPATPFAGLCLPHTQANASPLRSVNVRHSRLPSERAPGVASSRNRDVNGRDLETFR